MSALIMMNPVYNMARPVLCGELPHTNVRTTLNVTRYDVHNYVASKLHCYPGLALRSPYNHSWNSSAVLILYQLFCTIDDLVWMLSRNTLMVLIQMRRRDWH